MKEKLIIRADATQSIGFGHVMRCLSIALAWKEKKGPVTLITCCSSDSFIRKIETLGIRLVHLKASDSSKEDLRITETQISNAHARWLILDGYQFLPEYHAHIRETGCRLLVMDDYNHLSDYQADIIVNQNIGAETIAYNCPEETKKLLGLQYAVLRKEFLDAHRKTDCSPVVKNILITMGGSDMENISGLVLKALSHLPVSDFNIRFIVGPGFCSLDELKRIIRDTDRSVECVINPEKISDHMLWADIGIAAAGSTCWELAYIGLPSLLIVAAQNQEMNAHLLGKTGAFLNLGWYHDLTEKTVAAGIAQMTSDWDRRANMFKIQQALVDGNGAHRVVDEMSGFEG